MDGHPQLEIFRYFLLIDQGCPRFHVAIPMHAAKKKKKELKRTDTKQPFVKVVSVIPVHIQFLPHIF